MRTTDLFGMLFLSFLFTQCDIDPQPAFEHPFSQNTKNLWWKLGNNFTLLENGDTVSYHLEVDESTGTHYITREPTGDTVFAGTINKYEGRYYFNYPVRDSLYWISGVEIEKGMFRGTNVIRGWNAILQEMHYLQEAIERGEYETIVKKYNTTQSVIVLLPVKEKIHRFYDSVMDSLPVDTFISAKTARSSPPEETTVSQPERASRNVQQPSPDTLVKTVYPNPTPGNCTVKLKDSGPYDFHLLNGQRERLEKGRIQQQEYRLDLSQYASGMYYLQVIQPQPQKRQSVKVVKQ